MRCPSLATHGTDLGHLCCTNHASHPIPLCVQQLLPLLRYLTQLVSVGTRVGRGRGGGAARGFQGGDKEAPPPTSRVEGATGHDHTCTGAVYTGGLASLASQPNRRRNPPRPLHPPLPPPPPPLPPPRPPPPRPPLLTSGRRAERSASAATSPPRPPRPHRPPPQTHKCPRPRRRHRPGPGPKICSGGFTRRTAHSPPG